MFNSLSETRRVALLSVAALTVALPASAQLPAPTTGAVSVPAASMERVALVERAALSVRAVRVTGEIRLDGHLDDAAWALAPAVTGFGQVEPDAGQPAGAFATVVRIVYDDRALYVGAVMRDSLGVAGLRVPDLRRDFDYFEHDLFGVTLDPFGDRRTAVAFQVNPAGVLRDLQARDGSAVNREWDGVWNARTAVSDSGWTAEITIPWATLRYPDAGAVDAAGAVPWAVQFVRTARRAGMITGWGPWPRQQTPYHMQYAGTLTGLRPPPPRPNLRVQPYALTRGARAGDAPFADGLSADVGLDLKWVPSPSTVFDLTVNTDFAQVDADHQVVNLSRFSVFFPERRAFFLENAGVFDVGYSQFTPFYSRRIGLDQGLPVPLLGGARVVRASCARRRRGRRARSSCGSVGRT